MRDFTELAKNVCNELAISQDAQVLVILKTALGNAYKVGREDGAATYRVVEKDNQYVSPFPDLTWPTREQAEKFANEDAPDGWAGKLTVVESP